jgi:branched-subunit amino acid aminotransferase/4-amino-4-deoxychorismate lyase
MDRLVYYNDRIVEAGRAAVPSTNAGLLYGWGVFTTVRVYSGEVFALDRHWERLARHAQQALIELRIGSDDLARATIDLIEANRVREGRARITVLKSDAGPWGGGGERETDLLIFTSAERSRAGAATAITISPYRMTSHGPLAGIKRTAMLENLLALEEARSRDFSEAVMVNERGEVVGAAAANIFWAEAGELFTPSAGTGCIAGITRGFVIEIARRLSLSVVEGGFPVQRLLDATEVFLTSTGRGIVPVASFDLKQYDPERGWMTRAIDREFQKLIRDARIGS